MEVKTVAIIGAGVSGLASIKACLEENLEPTCFEYFDNLGGTWNLTECHVKGQGASVYETMRLNTSKNMTCYSDFPFPKCVQHYPPCCVMRDYIQSYAEYFKLLPYIIYNCDVTSVCPTDDHDTTGRWCVTYIHHDGNCEIENRTEFDAVMVCSGRERVAKYPYCRHVACYTGETMHTIEYRKPHVFKDKVIMIIGNGSSAGDVAVDATCTAKQVYLCTGHGAWITPRRQCDKSPPSDYGLTRASYLVPLCVRNFLLTMKVNNIYDHFLNRIVPIRNPGPLYSVICVNDHILDLIKAGKIIIKHDIKEITSKCVAFKDGTCIPEVDMIVYATGYSMVCKFLSTDILPLQMKDQSLYRVILPVTIKHPTLGLVGCLSLRGATTPTYELQARWLVAVFTKNITLPSTCEMANEAEERKKKLIRLFRRDKMWEVGVTYQQELAEDLSIVPPWYWIVTHPLAYVFYYTLTAFPMFHRIYGRHSWDGAWEAIQNAREWQT